MKRRGLTFLWLWAAASSWMLAAVWLRPAGRTQAEADVPVPGPDKGAAGLTVLREESVPRGDEPGEAPEAFPGIARGFVLDANGEPVEQAWVWFTGRTPGRTRTAGDGSFSIPVAPGFPARVWCLGREPREGGQGIACLGTDEVTAKAGDRDLVLHAAWHEVPAPPVRSVVVVLDPAGRPLPGITVSVEGGRELTDDAGRAEFRDVAGAWFAPAVTWPRGESAEDRGWVLPLQRRFPSGQECILQYRLGRKIEGVLVGTDGRARADVTLMVNNRGSFVASATTDALGRFSVLVDPFPPAPYRLIAAGDGSDWTEFEHDFLPGAPPVALTVDAAR